MWPLDGDPAFRLTAQPRLKDQFARAIDASAAIPMAESAPAQAATKARASSSRAKLR